MKFDQYFLYARVLPAILTAIPLILFHHFYINLEFSGFLYKIWTFRVVTELTMPLVFIITLAFINRVISKMLIEDKRYSSETKMPTTENLLFKSTPYEESYLNQIHQKIVKDFNIKLISKKNESQNETDSRKIIVQAVSHIKEKVKGGRLLLQHNMEYGFFRNLVGGSIIAIVVSIFSAIFFHFIYANILGFWLSIIEILIFGSVLIFYGKILDMLGQLYAKRLIQEYMTDK
jgi:hypothetical protein